MGIDRLDALLYINLDHRKDRKKSILHELKKLNIEKEKIHRISAHYIRLNGHRGCAISHIKALDWAIEKKLKKVLILEDDCIFIQKKEIIDNYVDSMLDTLIDNWDVFFLATNLKKYEDTQWTHIKRVLKSTCAHAYVVNSKYLPILRKCFSKALQEMRYDLFFFNSPDRAIDHAWHWLQSQDNWYIGQKLIARQKQSFSDIQWREVDKINTAFDVN